MEFQTPLIQSVPRTLEGESLLQAILANYAPQRRIIGLEIGWLKSADWLVLIPAIFDGPVKARSLCHLSHERVGRQCVVMFEQGNPELPLIMGFLEHDVLKENRPKSSGSDAAKGAEELREAEIDGQRITFTAKDEIVLKCGKASITLTRAGKVIIRGAYILSRSSGQPHQGRFGATELRE